MKIQKIMLVSFCLLAVALLSAHPANKLKVSYTQDTQILNVSFLHEVSDPDDHYIKEIKVFLNGDEIIKQKLTSQESSVGGEFSYRIVNLEAGDKLNVTTLCNKGGKNSEEIVLE